jgi:HlyD family secretion protein
MDKVIDRLEIAKKRKKKYLSLFIGIFAVVAFLFSISGFFETSVNVSEIKISKAEISSITNTISAVGKLHPKYEEVISSPLETKISKVYLAEGAEVKKDDIIMDLDKESILVEIENEQNQLSLQKKIIDKLKLQLVKVENEMIMDSKIKSFQIKELQSEVEDAKRLLDVGGGTADDVRKYKNKLRVAELEKQQAIFNFKNTKASLKSSIEEAEITYQIQQNLVEGLQKKLKMTTVKAFRPGVVTFVNQEVGTKVTEGEVLVKLADLSDYTVTGSISDSYASELFVGMETVVTNNLQQFSGKVTSVNPSVQNNIINFQVSLDEPFHESFRPKLSVDVFLVTETREQVIRVANGQAFNGPKFLDVFVLKDETAAQRRRITVGLKNKEYVQILEGVSAGDHVIVSGMEDFENTETVKIKR